MQKDGQERGDDREGGQERGDDTHFSDIGTAETNNEVCCRFWIQEYGLVNEASNVCSFWFHWIHTN